MNSKTICLNMIVKDESHIIIDTLKNLCSYIFFDYWVISDTGSSDNTKELITNFFKERGIPGELVEHKWIDFAHNRTQALDCAFNKTDYLFIFDADDSVVGDFKLPTTYIYDQYKCKFGSDFVYFRPLLITNRKRWRWKGVLHEFLENLEPVDGSDTIEGNYHLVSGRSGNRSKNPNKYFDDATILKEAHYKEFKTDYGLSCRYAFYCAQSYKDAGEKYQDMAIEWYKKCLDLNMWIQEKYYSCFTIGEIYSRQKDYNNALKYWCKTIEYDPERIEGIVSAANYLRSDGQHLLVNTLYHKFKNYKRNLENKLFFFQTMYNDKLEYENTISAYYVNDKQSGYECFKQIWNNNLLDYHLIKSSITNFKYYTDFLKTDTDSNVLQLFYSLDNIFSNISLKNDKIEEGPIKIWNTLFERVRPILTKYNEFTKLIIQSNDKNPKVMITFTTCKRLDLFKQTIASILNHWTDVNQIDFWFCVDDNSSENDRKDMTNLFPWINYYMKSFQEKGHLKSMNIIWNKLSELKPTYWIHMEDDFLFYYKTNYIEQSIAALNNYKSNNVKQVLFNRNYSETIDNYNTKGFISSVNDPNIVLHHYSKATVPYPNCNYWPHYSFRPSLTETSTILELGDFSSNNTFFEMDYAVKWTTAGYQSAFFNRITCRHIGRLTSDRTTKLIKNAYELNNESQFYSNENKEKEESIQIKDTNQNLIPAIKIINLERRQDRKNTTIQKLSDAQIDPSMYEFIKGVDGTTLKPTVEIQELFKGNDFGFRKGVVGCALSHYNLWKQLIDDKNNDCYLIMEDDFTLSPNFKLKFDKLIQSGEFVKKEVLFLGYHMFEKERDNFYDIYNIDIQPNNFFIETLNRNLYIGGTFLYSMNKMGAQKMIDYIKENGIKHGIDYVMKINKNLHSYECQPQIVFSDWNENGKKIDSDIQNIYESLDFSTLTEHLDDSFVFIKQLDHHGDDMFFEKGSIPLLMERAIKDKDCVAFNTLGFFKKKADINILKSSPYFGEKDGIYIKKAYLNKNKENDSIRIKMLCNWTNSKQLCKELSNMCETGFKWKNYELVWTDVKEDIDYYIIINSVSKGVYFDPKRTIVFQMEPWVNDDSKPWGVKTWNNWADPSPLDFLAVRGRKTDCHNNAFWQLELSLNDLQNPELFEKTQGKTISSICSSKYFDEGHIARIDFLKFLESKGDVQLDIWNQDNKHGFTNYRGPLSPYVDKSKGLVPYKYYFMMENNFEKNFITEKLWEPILCETLVFYYGCPNVSDYIDPRAFVQLDINDFEKSYQLIQQALNEDWWSQRIDVIRQEKCKILNELAFFPTIDKIICQNKKPYEDDYNKYFKEYTTSNISSNPKKYCFIHSCHLKGVGTSILNDIIGNFINTNSNLIQHFEKIFILNIGEELDPSDIHFQNDKIEIINYSDNTQLFELPTINLIRTFCEYNDNCEILYLHTKGITHNHKQITDWTNMMLYFLLNKCTDCFELLKQYDTVGCNYQEVPNKHYSGNFWWANSNYIKRLNKICDGSKRHDAEWWILSDKLVNSFEIHNSQVNHYQSEYPREKICKYFHR